jgi:hypothetical protein
MANTFTLIEAKTVSSAIASIEFTSIPATYTDLCLKFSGRNNRSGQVLEEFVVTFNGNNSAIYSEKGIRGSGSSVANNSTTAVTQLQDFGQPAASTTSDTFSNWEVYIPNYTSSNNKSVQFDGVTENNATEAYAYLNAGLFASTTAISSLKVACKSTHLIVANSSFYLYGIKNT